MSHGHALQIVDVTKRFGGAAGIVAVSGVSFDVRPGEFISLIGPSGCGKSTLFNIIGGFVKDYQGVVLLDGSAKVSRRSVGMVFQEESTFPWRTTLQNVTFPLEASGMPAKARVERARDLIKLVGIEGFENNYPAELSGGMRQRTALARTLAFDPKVLLMDEPFAGLDEQTRLLLGDKILQIQQELKQTTLLITHNITEAVQLSDRVIVMTYRPGTVKRIVPIDLPRPRSSEIISSARFGQLVGLIWNDLREEANRGMVDTQTILGGAERGN
jgi:NitT/TauT family transport system ATP-binding protein